MANLIRSSSGSNSEAEYLSRLRGGISFPITPKGVTGLNARPALKRDRGLRFLLSSMNWFVYILHSVSLCRYYVGMTQNVRRRTKQHLYGNSFWTRRADDWNQVFCSRAMSIDQARQLELTIKKRGAEKFLSDRQSVKNPDKA